MSDSINYDELDKAVTAAINAKQAAKSEPKPAAKPVAVKPQLPKKPASRGMFMDFAPINNSRRVVIKKTVETRTIARVAANPATKATPAIARPRITPARPVQARPIAKPIAKPAAPIRAAAQTFPARPVTKPAPKPTQAQPALKVAEKPTPKPTQAQPVLKKAVEAAPNANNYSLGVRSPFLNTDAKVEKRPLGSNIPETSTSALRSTRNVYSQKSALKNTEAAKKHIVTEGGKKKSGWLWALIVLAVIAAGGGLGYLAYLIVFAK